MGTALRYRYNAMPLPGFETAMGAIEAAVGSGQVYALVAPTGKHKSELFTNVLNKAEALAIVRAPEGTAEPKNPDEIRRLLVDSPLLLCFRDVLTVAPRPYVFYAPPSSGTSAARALMHVSIPRLFDNEKERPKALMLTGTMGLEIRRYFDHIGDTFDSGTTPWFTPLVAALSRTKEEVASGKFPSVLILDDFDVEGHDDVNISNMKKFCHDLAALRDLGEQYEFFVFVMTQSDNVANKLCRINNWKKIGPMPGSYNPPPDTADVDKAHLPDPNWTNLPWASEQLKKMVEKRFSGEQLDGVDWEPLCMNGENPGQVLEEVKTRICRKHRVSAAAAINDFDLLAR